MLLRLHRSSPSASTAAMMSGMCSGSGLPFALVGMKSRGVYETPGGTILYEAHKALEQICIERDTLHYKQQVALRYAEIVYNGQWFHPLREALQTFMDHTNATVTGTARVRLFKGRAQLIGATSPNSLYDPQLASFSMEGFDVTASCASATRQSTSTSGVRSTPAVPCIFV